MTDSDLRHSPLEDAHRRLGAKLGAFGGWLMPIEYGGTLSEHRAVRERAGLFDLSHLGKVDVVGPSSLPTIQRLFTNDARRVGVGTSQYHQMLNELEPFTTVNPSAENLAKYFFDETNRHLKSATNGRVWVKDVTIWETDTTTATYFE